MAEFTMSDEIEQAQANGYSVAERGDDWAILKRTSWGNWKYHVVLLFATMGVGNVLYAAWHRGIKSDTKRLGDVPSYARRQLTLRNLLRSALRAVGMSD